MLNQFERLAVYLHGLRWWFLGLCAVVYSTLAALAFRGYEVVQLFIVSFLWLFGFVFFVEIFQRTKKLEEAERMKGFGPRFLNEWVKTDLFWYAQACFFVFYFGFLAFFTIKMVTV